MQINTERQKIEEITSKETEIKIKELNAQLECYKNDLMSKVYD